MTDFLTFAPPGHFYSPLPDYDHIQRSYTSLVASDREELPGIDLRVHEQLLRLQQIASLPGEFPFTAEASRKFRYYTNNVFYTIGDAAITLGMLRLAQPKRVVEIGGGYSSALILDIADRYLDSCEYICAEPDPARLRNLLRSGDESRFKLIPSTLGALPRDVFTALRKDDVLFVDSSHVVKIGSDVAALIFEILPLLAPGVLIHVHDIFWPFEYPKEWYAEGRAWNEAHFMRAFLMFNRSFSIEYFNDYIARWHRAALERHLSFCLASTGGSLWLRRQS